MTCTSMIQEVMGLQGSVSCAIVDLESGSRLVRSGNDASAQVVQSGTIYARLLRAKLQLTQEFYGGETLHGELLEDLMVTMEKHYHLVRPLRSKDALPHLFLYLVMDKDRANLPLTRRKIAEMSRTLSSQSGSLLLGGEESGTAMKKPVHEPAMATGPYSGSPSVYFSSGTKNTENKQAENNQEELPAFMRDDQVMRLLGLTAAVK